MVVTDLHHQRVQVQDRIDRFQRPGLPRFHLLGDRVGDVGDRLVAQLGAQGAFQMSLNVADRHPPGIQADDHLRQPADPPLALRHQPRLKGAVTVPRGSQINIADLGAQPFTRGPVPGVAGAVPCPVNCNEPSSTWAINSSSKPPRTNLSTASRAAPISGTGPAGSCSFVTTSIICAHFLRSVYTDNLIPPAS